jgi:hypothetical protein
MLIVMKKPELPKDAVQIRLTRNLFAYVSSCDEIRIKKYHWQAVKSSSGFYARTKITTNGKHQIIRMHRFVMNCPDFCKVHHKDHNRLNNCRENLEIISELAHRHMDGWHYFAH